MKLEVIPVPVADLDRAKAFYEGLGWRLDADFHHNGDRAIQLTPPGSPCSIHFNPKGKPGSAQGMFLVVSDIQVARDDLMRRGVEVGEIFHFAACPAPFGGQVSGIAPEHQSYGSYAAFGDPDGNVWLLQEVTSRFPGRVAGDTTYASVNDLALAAAGGDGAHRAREAHRRAGRELAGLVRRVHGAGAIGRRAAAVNASTHLPIRNSYALADHLPLGMLLTYPDAGHGSLFSIMSHSYDTLRCFSIPRRSIKENPPLCRLLVTGQ